MAKFLFVFHGGGMPDTPEEGEKAMAAWGAWYEKFGAHVVEGGAPVMKSHTVFADRVEENGGANPVSGYCVFNAKDYAEAARIAAECPMVADGSGSCEIAEMMDM